MEQLIEEIRLLTIELNSFESDEDLRCVRNRMMMLRPEQARVDRVIEGLRTLHGRGDDALICKFDAELRKINCGFAQEPLLGWHLHTPAGYIQVERG